jgi:deoxycytidylate deaminase
MKMRFFKIAQTCSKKSTSNPRVGCIIVKKNRIVGLGYNDRRKTHPRAKTMSQTIHAELHAVIGVPAEDLKGAHVYVFREYVNGDLAMTKPCAACHAVLEAAGVKKVFYTTYGGYDSYEI